MDSITSVLSDVSLKAMCQLLKEEDPMFWPDMIIAGKDASEIAFGLIKNGVRIKLFYIVELPPNMWIVCDSKQKVCGVSMPD